MRYKPSNKNENNIINKDKILFTLNERIKNLEKKKD